PLARTAAESRGESPFPGLSRALGATVSPPHRSEPPTVGDAPQRRRAERGELPGAHPSPIAEVLPPTFPTAPAGGGSRRAAAPPSQTARSPAPRTSLGRALGCAPRRRRSLRRR